MLLEVEPPRLWMRRTWPEVYVELRYLVAHGATPAQILSVIDQFVPHSPLRGAIEETAWALVEHQEVNEDGRH